MHLFICSESPQKQINKLIHLAPLRCGVCGLKRMFWEIIFIKPNFGVYHQSCSKVDVAKMTVLISGNGRHLTCNKIYYFVLI